MIETQTDKFLKTCRETKLLKTCRETKDDNGATIEKDRDE
jgi:hypothetical protein